MKDGEGFISVENIVVTKQFQPKLAANGLLFCGSWVKSGNSEMRLQLWDGAAGWKLPLDTPLTLRGKFSRGSYKDAPTIRCDELSKPEGAEQFKPEEIQASMEKPSVKASIDVGLRAIEYVSKKGFPQLSEAAFSFAAQAFLDGHKLE